MNKTAFDLEKKGMHPQCGPFCPYCGEESVLRDASYVYHGDNNYGNVWVCRNYPKCDAFVGVHKNGEWMNYPLGRLANADLREAKKKAHSVFDVLWKQKLMDRGKAYRWLQEQMELPVEDCHIGEMSLEQCYKVYELSISYIQANRSLIYD